MTRLRYHRRMDQLRGWSRAVAIAIGIATTGVATTAAADEPSPQQKQAYYAKPSVVRIIALVEAQWQVAGRDYPQFWGGTGSGFFLSADGYIATNAHVVEPIQAGEEKAREATRELLFQDLMNKHGDEIKGMSEAEREALGRTINLVGMKTSAKVVLPDGTQLDYKIKAYGAPVDKGEGKDVAIIKVDIENAPTLPIGDSDKVQVQDSVLAIGYPGAADLAGLLDDKSQLEASITDGAVAAMKRTTDGEQVIQITATIAGGNSGGPAVNGKGEVIGLVTFSATRASGFNFVVSSKTLKKFVKESGADTTISKTYTLWRSALDKFWASKFDGAIAEFEEVMTLFPPHSEAPRLVKQARALKKEGKGKSESGGSSSSTGIVIALFVFGGLAAVLAVVFIRKSKKTGGPQPAMAGPPGAPPPGFAPNPYPPRPNPYAAPSSAPPPGAPMMAGGGGVVAKTVAIQQPGQNQPIAATAFGSLAVGSLTCTRGLLAGQRFSLTPQGILIGRQPGMAQVVVNDHRASGKHVWIGYENGALVAIDQGTTNGTFVNDVRNGRISKAALRDGDVVIVAEPDVLSLQVKTTG
jgi:S1-C subfamily serine protease